MTVTAAPTTFDIDDADRGAFASDPRPAPRSRSRVGKMLRGRDEDPTWVRPVLLLLLVLTGVLYTWDLGASGWANDYYSAAVQAATKSWKALLFGSTDASNFITVDKTPASLWVMAISARVFGVSSWSILVPQALSGVATVGMLYLTVRRWTSAATGLLAGAILATTPVAALIFRFNNPDALLTLLLVASAYAMTRAIEEGRTRSLVAAGVLLGFAFLTKELQALLVLPGFALAYLLAGPHRIARRMRQLLALGVALLCSAGWWVAAITLTPAGSRPYVGGSRNNTFWDVLFGYNGFGRLTGNETGSVGGSGLRSGSWGPTGWTRMFNSEFGTQASWLLPAALLLLAAGVAYTARRSRTDRLRAALVMWGGWLLVTGVSFSLARGIIHPYYTVALGPPIAAIGAVVTAKLWSRRETIAARIVLGTTIAITSLWTHALMSRSPDWYPWLRVAVVPIGFATAALCVLVPRLPRRLVPAWAASAIVVVLAAPAAAAMTTAAVPHSGALPPAGPAVRASGPGPFGVPGGFGAGRAMPVLPPGARAFPGGNPFPGGGGATGGAAFGGPGAMLPGGGGIGGLLDGVEPGERVTEMLEAGAGGFRWVAAAIGANRAAGFQLASDEPVMAIGGFNGSDPTPTLAEFEEYVAAGDVHYFVAGGGFGAPPGGGAGPASEIESWVVDTFEPQTVDGVTIYDLTAAKT